MSLMIRCKFNMEIFIRIKDIADSLYSSNVQCMSHHGIICVYLCLGAITIICEWRPKNSSMLKIKCVFEDKSEINCYESSLLQSRLQYSVNIKININLSFIIGWLCPVSRNVAPGLCLTHLRANEVKVRLSIVNG